MIEEVGHAKGGECHGYRTCGNIVVEKRAQAALTKRLVCLPVGWSEER